MPHAVAHERSSAAAVDSPQAWRVAIASSIVIGASFGTVYSFGAFFDAMAAEFDSGLGPTAIVFGITAFLFFGTGAASGFLADRWGARPLVWVGGAIFAVGLFLTSRVGALWHGYLTYGIGAGLGGGLFVSPVFAMVNGWFERRRGLAQGVVATGSGLGTLVLLPLAERLIDRIGWRDTYVVLSIVAVVVFLGIGSLIRRPPIEPVPVPASHVRAVMRTAPFRRLWACSALQSGSMGAAFAFIVPFARDEGVSSQTAALLIAVVGAASIIGRLVLTSRADRVGPVRMLQASFAIQPVAFVIWLFAGGSVPVLFLFVVVLGVAYGGYVALVGVVAAHLFGLRGIGAILGWTYLAAGIGSLIVPAVVGFVGDATDTRWFPILLVVAASAVGAALLASLQREPVVIEGSAATR